MKILLLEDDPLLGESLKEYLELDDLTIDWAQDGNEVLDWTFENRYDLYILDINVPEINGLDLLKELRESGDETPAIYISALSDIDSISAGFDAGAVDYLKKPFDPEELALRIRHRFGAQEALTRYGDLTFDPKTGMVETADETIHLGDVQQKIFAHLLQKQGELVSSETLFDYMREPSFNALRATISKMKKRLGIEIRNIRGEGYLLEKI
jgi:DNA-binding response OmpR family regulator